MKFEVMSPEAMHLLAQGIGSALVPGDVLALIGDLGTGKTTLSKGIGKALGVPGHLSSPSYTIVNVYSAAIGPLYHADVYRIDDISQLDDIGFFDYLHDGGVVLVEWADKIKDALLLETDSYIELCLTALEEGRRVEIEGYEAFMLRLGDWYLNQGTALIGIQEVKA